MTDLDPGTPMNVKIAKGDTISLEGIIPGMKSASVVEGTGIYSYAVQVDGHCPEEYRNVQMWFRDETDDVYGLTVDSSTEKTHRVNYNSDGPTIVQLGYSLGLK